MIFENNCLFLFNDDIDESRRGKSTKYDLSSFAKKGMDVNEYKHKIDKAVLIVHIDAENRQIRYMKDRHGSKKDQIEKY